MRIFRCSDIFNVKRILEMYKDYTKERVDKIIENDPTQAEDIETDVIVITK